MIFPENVHRDSPVSGSWKAARDDFFDYFRKNMFFDFFDQKYFFRNFLVFDFGVGGGEIFMEIFV